MAINNNVSVQFNGGLLPDIVLLTQCNFHRGTRLNAMKRFCICSLCMVTRTYSKNMDQPGKVAMSVVITYIEQWGRIMEQL